MIRKASDSSKDITSTAIQTGGDIASSAISATNPLGWVGQLIDGVGKMVGNVMTSITSLGLTRNNNSATTQQLYWLTAKDRNEKQPKNIGFYIIIGLMVVAVVTIIIINNKKAK